MNREQSRRGFLRLAGGAAAGAAFSDPIARALATPARRVTGSLSDLEHVVVFMQENRSFDHYFGTLNGVRGFSDPRPLILPGGSDVFRQPQSPGSPKVVTPFRLDASETRAQSLGSLDHSWKGDHELWKWHDAWIPAKSKLTMGYFARGDIPFYYALADAFTVCDAYHCSVFGPTNPNRMFLFTGTSGLGAGYGGRHVVENPPDEPNETADPANDSDAFEPYRWTTYAERLEAAGVSWRVYQEYDNYGDNPLAYFANFRGENAASPMGQRARAWVAGSHAGNAQSSDGEHLVAAFARDVAADALPRVSWIVAPYKLCEHPSATPGAGQDLTARLIAALTANPEVWAKTALILNYDENDGFFDHAPPLVPPVGKAPGKSTVALDGELYGDTPVGLGPRVPMIVVSPWTKGGWVNSQLFDHTSVIRLLEARFGVMEPQITPWRRTVTGDLTSVFDFQTPDHTHDRTLLDLPDLPGQARAQQRLPAPKPPRSPAQPPQQEAGPRPARALPYAFDATARAGDQGLEITLANFGQAGAGFGLYPAQRASDGPWWYAVEANKTLTDVLPLDALGYDLTLHGPNGFLRQFRGGRADALAVDHQYLQGGEVLRITLRNSSSQPVTARLSNAHAPKDVRTRVLTPGAQAIESWRVTQTGHWYDICVTATADARFLRRLAGHIETGRPSRSDPALDWAAADAAAV